MSIESKLPTNDDTRGAASSGHTPSNGYTPATGVPATGVSATAAEATIAIAKTVSALVSASRTEGTISVRLVPAFPRDENPDTSHK